MGHYHDPDDLKIVGEFKRLAPAEFKGFVELDSAVAREDGAIPRKYRELIALAVACFEWRQFPGAHPIFRAPDERRSHRRLDHA